jgi:hypothetical protein
MLKGLFSVFVLSLFLFASCGRSGNSVNPITNSEKGKANIMVKSGSIGGFKKSRVIELRDIDITLSVVGQTSITQTLSLSGSGSSTASSLFEGLEPDIVWTVTATSYDTNDIVIHDGSTTFTALADTTVEVSLSLDALYSMLNANYTNLGQDMDSCILLVDAVVVGSHVLTQTDINSGSVIVSYDYVTTNIEHTITLNIYGTKWQESGLFYTGSIVMTPTPGSNINESITLVYVGPGKGRANVTVNIGSIGTITIDGNADGV